MKRKFMLFLLTCFILILSETWLPNIRILGVQPDLFLLFIVFLALLEGPIYGAVAGGVLGLLYDIMIGQYIGLGMLGRILVGFTAGCLGRKFYQDNYWIPIVATMLAIIITEIIFWFGVNLLGWSLSFWEYSLPYMVIACVYNGILAPFLYVLFYFCSQNGWLKRENFSEIG